MRRLVSVAIGSLIATAGFFPFAISPAQADTVIAVSRPMLLKPFPNPRETSYAGFCGLTYTGNATFMVRLDVYGGRDGQQLYEAEPQMVGPDRRVIRTFFNETDYFSFYCEAVAIDVKASQARQIARDVRTTICTPSGVDSSSGALSGADSCLPF